MLIIDLFSLCVLFCTLARDTLKIVFLLSFHDLCPLMHGKKMKFQRNCFLGYHHMIFTIFTRSYAHAYIRKSLTRTKGAKASTSSENASSYFCDHFFSLPSYLARKLCTNYPGIELVRKVLELQRKKGEFAVKCLRCPYNSKTVISRR